MIINSFFICKFLLCRNRQSATVLDVFPLSRGNTEESFHEDCSPESNTEESSQDDCLPFRLDEDSSGPIGSPSFSKTFTQKPVYGFPLGHAQKAEITGSRINSRRFSEGNLKGSLKSTDLDLLLDNNLKQGSFF